MTQFGIDHLLSNPDLLKNLRGKNVALVAHPASLTHDMTHSVDALIAAGCPLTCAFGPQHGMRGDKQDNMIESDDYLDATHKLPVISLYGEHRKPTPAMLEDVDLVLFDLQDVGCRIYTYITTLLYFCEACASTGTTLWVLDRPNPAGRPVDGLYLEPGEESFVGSAPLPTRHGLTVGELAGWFASRIEADLDLKVINLQNYDMSIAPGYGWPNRPWINPSPNAASLNMTRCFPGTVLLEGTNLSEGRGTTIPLEVIGAPGLPIDEMLQTINSEAPDWLAGINIRDCYFSPTFHKHTGELCSGVQFHTDGPEYQHEVFRPYRLIAGLLKALRMTIPDYDLWRFHEYEYEPDRTPIDVINGGPLLRHWVDDSNADFTSFEAQLKADRERWLVEREPYLIY